MADREINYLITSEYDGMAVQEFLAGKGYSMQLIKHLKKYAEGVCINGEACFLKHPIHQGDELKIFIKEMQISEKILPFNLPFPVLYEDDDLVVVNKPANMPIHPSLKNYENTLGNAAAYYFGKREGDAVEGFVYRCINRLDRDTTGLTILAKNMLSACVLYDEMMQGKIHRTYFAIVEGYFEEKSGTINLPIARKEGSTIEREVNLVNGEEAVTHYEVIREFDNMSFIKLNLETGRTHQIRVHMTHVGHPLIGDFLYNPENLKMPRQALHAGKLEFFHPIDGKMICIEAEVPDDMKAIMPD